MNFLQTASSVFQHIEQKSQCEKKRVEHEMKLKRITELKDPSGKIKFSLDQFDQHIGWTFQWLSCPCNSNDEYIALFKRVEDGHTYQFRAYLGFEPLRCDLSKEARLARMRELATQLELDNGFLIDMHLVEHDSKSQEQADSDFDNNNDNDCDDDDGHVENLNASKSKTKRHQMVKVIAKIKSKPMKPSKSVTKRNSRKSQ